MIEDPRLFAAQCTSLEPVETVHDNPWFSVRNRNGYFTIEFSSPQTIVLPVVDNKAIIMVRVYRPVVADITYELPAGGAKEGESPTEAAARELSEETGIEILELKRFKILPALIHTLRSPAQPHIFQIDLKLNEYKGRKSHDDEIAEVELFYFDDILKKIITGEIYVGFHIAIIVRYFLQNQIRINVFK